MPSTHPTTCLLFHVLPVHSHGFLPLHGLEVPLMVLQSKVFLVALLHKFTPSLSMRKTFIRRVGAKVRDSFAFASTSIKRPTTGAAGGEGGTHLHEMDYSMDDFRSADLMLATAELGGGGESTNRDVSHSEARNMFTKTPFPEPRRVIHLRPRGLDNY